MKAAMNRVVITGGTSMLAQALERLLVSRGIAVTLIVRPDSARLHRLNASQKTVVFSCDLKNITLLEKKQLGGHDAFFHFGWDGSNAIQRNDAALQNSNIQSTLDAVNLAARLGCSVFLGAGSQAEYGCTDSVLTSSTKTDPDTCYGIAKLAAGRLSRIVCRQKGIRHVWARILSVYGPGGNTQTMMMSCIHSLVYGERMSFTSGEQLWDYLYCDDAAQAFYRMGLYGRDGYVYPLGSGQTRSLKQFILAARDIVNPAMDVGLGELPYPPGQIMNLKADISELVRDTGFTPTISFEEGVRLTARWLEEINK